MSPEEALRESRERLADEAAGGGAAYRQLAHAWRRGEIEREVAVRLAARGLRPDGTDPVTGKAPKKGGRGIVRPYQEGAQ